jgi:membrane protein implicated in regulation of membrane protease activity
MTEAAWLWLVGGLVLGAAELLSFSYFLIWPGLAAVAVGLWLVAAPATELWTQVALFAVLALALTAAGRKLVAREGAAPAAGGLNRRGARLVGRQVRVRSVTHDVAEVEVDGEIWRARGEGLSEGETAVVASVDGATLVLRRRPERAD